MNVIHNVNKNMNMEDELSCVCVGGGGRVALGQTNSVKNVGFVPTNFQEITE